MPNNEWVPFDPSVYKKDEYELTHDDVSDLEYIDTKEGRSFFWRRPRTFGPKVIGVEHLNFIRMRKKPIVKYRGVIAAVHYDLVLTTKTTYTTKEKAMEAAALLWKGLGVTLLDYNQSVEEVIK